MADKNLSTYNPEDAAEQAYTTVYTFMVQHSAPPFVAVIVAGVAGCVFLLLVLVRMLLTFVLADVAVPAAIAFIEILEGIRKDGAPQFAKLSASILGEFMGIDSDSLDLATGKKPADVLQRAQAIGGLIHDMLEKEFAPAGTVDSVSGPKAARAFSGFCTNFAVTNATISMIAEMVSFEHLQQLRELGVEVAQALGLGRLHRQALGPLIRNLIAEPYDRALRKKYRQDRMSTGQYVTALQRGTIATAEVRNAIAEQGYPEEIISELIQQNAGKFHTAELDRLQRFDNWSDDDVLYHVRLHGYTEELGRAIIRSERLRSIEAQEAAYAGELLHLAQHRFIDQGTYEAEIDTLHLTAEDKVLRKRRVAMWLEHEHKTLTFSEMLYLHEHAAINSGDFDIWASEQGFNDRDKLLLTLFVAEKEIEYQARKAKQPHTTTPGTGTGGTGSH